MRAFSALGVDCEEEEGCQEDQVNGALCLARPSQAGPWTEQERSLLIGVTDYVAIAIAQFAAQEKLKMLKAEDIAACVLYTLTQPKRCDVVVVQIRPHLPSLVTTRNQ